ncbi:hypothetical protein AZH53_07215 [Methanomicrobiaceae archaeon CYW5]|nr:hypothetical protein [Methanovulcanius yangii]
MNIRDHLLHEMGLDEVPEGAVPFAGHHVRFIGAKGRLIHEEGLDARAAADLIIFISRHTSKNPVRALTVHVTGNFRDAALGGAPRQLARAAPEWMHAVLLRLAASAPDGFRVSYEVTHHGPTDLATPSFFVEIGSTEEEWVREDAGRAVAQSVAGALHDGPSACVVLTGFGGNHYAARQTEIAIATRAAWGHIAHTREVGMLDAEMIRRMTAMSGADAAYIDRKALSRDDLAHVMTLLDDCGIVRLSESELRQMGDLPFSTYCAFRARAAEESDGARLIILGISGEGFPVRLSIPPDLFDEALKIDENLFWDLIRDIPAAGITTQSGRPLPVFFAFAGHEVQVLHLLITSCVKILVNDGSTTVSGDSITIRRVRFNPRRAAELGVPKGPLFGRLAAGHEIEIGGTVITPSMVSDVSEQVIHVPGLESYL